MERARRAKFPNERQLRRHFEGRGEDLQVADASAYETLVEAVQGSPERVFTAYKSKGARGELSRWIFTRENVLVVVGFDSAEVVTTCHRAEIDQRAEGFIALGDYLKGRDDGKQMVEIKL